MPSADASANDTQPFQDALSQLWGRIQPPGDTPSPVLRPGMPGAPPDTAGLPINGPRTPVVPYNATTPAAPAALPPSPKPSDDPAVTMPSLPTPPTFRSPDLLNQRLATRAAIQDTERAHANDARDFRPHWYDRLLGGVTAGVVGGATGNSQLGADVGGRVTSRAFNRADQERQRQEVPLYRELNAQKEDEPFYTKADESSQRTFEDKRQNAVEERNQITAKEKNEMAQQLADIKQQMADNKHEEAEARIKELQARLDEKTSHDKDWLDLQNKLLDIKRDALEVRGAATANQFREVEDRKNAALAKAEEEFNKATEGLNLKSPHTDAVQDDLYSSQKAEYDRQVDILNKKKAQAQSAYLVDIEDLSRAMSTRQGAPTKPPTAGAKLTDQKIAKQYLVKVAGEKGTYTSEEREKARALARADHWDF